MTAKQGNLSINSENMLPIIKKWLYSDHDIFAREVVSNACDAISKLHKLEIMGEYQYPDEHKDSIHVIVDPDNKTIQFSDTGLGMTADEVEEYITQIAFSGATDFFEKYKDKANKDDIIGHFGLGFYSVFMVSDNVEIDTLSYKDGETPVHWECDGSSTYTMEDGSMPYVILGRYESGADGLEFADAFTAYMQGVYADLQVTEPAGSIMIGGNPYARIAYQYAVSGYTVRDTRLFLVAGGYTYMFGAKEVPALNYFLSEGYRRDRGAHPRGCED